SVGDVCRGPTAARKRQRHDAAQRVALVVIEEEEAAGRRREVGQPSGRAAPPFGVLMRVSHADLRPIEDAGRTQRSLPASDASSLNRQGQKDIDRKNTSELQSPYDLVCR